MSTANFTTMSARDAKTRFGELLDAALGRPVGITKHDRLTAFMVSKRDFEAMLAHIELLQDKLLLAEAELARREGFAGADRVEAFIADFTEDKDHAEAGDHPRHI